MNTTRQPQYRTIETDTIDFLNARVKALEEENLKLHKIAYPQIIEVVLEAKDKYPACNKPLKEIQY